MLRRSITLVLGTALLCFSSWMSRVSTTHGLDAECQCTSLYDKKIRINRVVNYTIQRDGICPIRALMVHTLNGSVLCVSPDTPWAKNLIRYINWTKRRKDPVLEMIKETAQETAKTPATELRTMATAAPMATTTTTMVEAVETLRTTAKAAPMAPTTMVEVVETLRTTTKAAPMAPTTMTLVEAVETLSTTPPPPLVETARTPTTALMMTLATAPATMELSTRTLTTRTSSTAPAKTPTTAPMITLTTTATAKTKYLTKERITCLRKRPKKKYHRKRPRKCV